MTDDQPGPRKATRTWAVGCVSIAIAASLAAWTLSNTEFRDVPDPWGVLAAPGYAAVIRVVSLTLGAGATGSARIVALLSLAAAAFLAGAIVARTARSGTGMWFPAAATLIVGFHPALLGLTRSGSPDLLFLATTLAAVLAFVSWDASNRAWLLPTAGVLLGLASLVSYLGVVSTAIALIWMLMRGRSGLRAALLAALALVPPIAWLVTLGTVSHVALSRPGTSASALSDAVAAATQTYLSWFGGAAAQNALASSRGLIVLAVSVVGAGLLGWRSWMQHSFQSLALLALGEVALLPLSAWALGFDAGSAVLLAPGLVFAALAIVVAASHAAVKPRGLGLAQGLLAALLVGALALGSLVAGLLFAAGRGIY